MVKKVGKNHYVASRGEQLVSSTASKGYLAPHPPRSHNRGYSTDGEESGRGGGGSERTLSEYTVRGAGGPGGRRPPSHLSHHEHDIYVTSGAYRAPSEYSRGSRYSRGGSHYSYRSGVTGGGGSTIRTRVDKKRGLVIETMSAPNPFCPNTRGVCCLMLLLNLAIVLVTLGFVIVIQFFEPFFVWILGIVFLIFGFMTLVGSLIYCVTVCRDSGLRSPSEVGAREHYWTRHWQKNIGSPPQIQYTPPNDKYLSDTDHYSISEKQSHHRY